VTPVLTAAKRKMSPPGGNAQSNATTSTAAATTTTYTFSNNAAKGSNSATGSQSANYTLASGSSMAKTKMKNQLIARRKAAKMLISVAVLFAICFLPVHLLNIMRFAAPAQLMSILGSYLSMVFQFSHVIVYVNSCVNPLIYNFMSGMRFK
jgi:hypothetical protein